MIAVITGDIINSKSSDSEIWLQKLKNLLGNWAESPANWEIYRGDEFQYRCEVDDVFLKAIAIKSLIKSFENLDVRIAIGIGDELYTSDRITESNGSSFVNSGKLLRELKNECKTLAIKTPNEKLDRDLNMLFKWASIDFDNWSQVSAQIIEIFINNENLNQEEVAKKLHISQSSVSQRLKRANYDLVLETDQFFRKKITEL